jgi:Ser/Thr protein kinase RdoA (MazF antagonist)
MVTAGEQDYLLRFNHASERTVETIVAELAFIEHLSACGVRVARPLPSLAGNLVESVMTDLGLFHSVLFEFLPGQTRELDELDMQSIEAWGQALGQVHQASQGLKIEGRLDWSGQINLLRQIVPPSETVVWREAAIIEALLVNLPRSSASYGLIHYDFEPDNQVWSEEGIGIFDLDDCAYEWYAMDLSNALCSELFDDRIERFDFSDIRLQGFIKGYRSVRNIDEQEVRWMPLFLRLDNLVAFARIYRSITDDPLEHEPQWTVDLRLKLGKELDKLRAGFQDYPVRDFLPGF